MQRMDEDGHAWLEDGDFDALWCSAICATRLAPILVMTDSRCSLHVFKQAEALLAANPAASAESGVLETR